MWSSGQKDKECRRYTLQDSVYQKEKDRFKRYKIKYIIWEGPERPQQNCDNPYSGNGINKSIFENIK